jgi:hypothetical protein
LCKGLAEFVLVVDMVEMCFYFLGDCVVVLKGMAEIDMVVGFVLWWI